MRIGEGPYAFGATKMMCNGMNINLDLKRKLYGRVAAGITL